MHAIFPVFPRVSRQLCVPKSLVQLEQ